MLPQLLVSYNINICSQLVILVEPKTRGGLIEIMAQTCGSPWCDVKFYHA